MVVRHNLYKGATQIKMAASGSVSGIADPLYVLEFTEKKIEAAVQAAEDFGTYVQVHAHNAAAIKRALKAGVKTIEFRAKNSMVFTCFLKQFTNIPFSMISMLAIVTLYL